MTISGNSRFADRAILPEGVATKLRKRSTWWRFLRENVSLVSFTAIVVVFAIVAGERFMTLRNWQLILEQLPVLAILSIGMTFVITGGFIDLSVGSALGLAGLCGALAAQQFGLPGLLVGVIVGTVIGFANGLLFAGLRIPSFIATLAAMVILRAIVSIASGGFAVYLDQVNAEGLEFLQTIGRFPILVIILVVIVVVSVLVHRYSVFGQDLKAIGGDERVAARGGVRVTLTKVQVFTLSGLMVGIASILNLAQYGAAGPQSGVGLELDAISAVVLGGTPLTGGHGSVWKTMLGALALVTLADGLVIAGVPPSWNDIVRGGLLIAAIAIALDRGKIGVVK